MTQTNNEREALQVALGALSNAKFLLNKYCKDHHWQSGFDKDIATVKAALLQNEQQEAVGQIYEIYNGCIAVDLWNDDLKAGTKLYTSPPKQAIPETEKQYQETITKLGNEIIRLNAEIASLTKLPSAPTNTEVGNDR